MPRSDKGTQRTDPLVRFWAKVEKSDGCWRWIGATNGRGYGLLWFAGRNAKAHRLSWEIHNGPIHGGLHVCHRCDNPPCVNPDHLFVGTMSDNIQDCSNKGRNGVHTHPERLARGDRNGMRKHRDRAPRGESHGMTTLTAKEVDQIRDLRHAMVQKDIAAAYGVCRNTVQNIQQGKTWGKR